MIQTAIENPYATSTPKKLSKEKKVKEMVGKNISPLFTTRRDEMILLNTGSWVKVSLCAHTDMRLLWVNKGRTELSDWKTASWTRQRDDSSFALTALFYWSYEKKNTLYSWSRDMVNDKKSLVKPKAHDKNKQPRRGRGCSTFGQVIIIRRKCLKVWNRKT